MHNQIENYLCMSWDCMRLYVTLGITTVVSSSLFLCIGHSFSYFLIKGKVSPSLNICLGISLISIICYYIRMLGISMGTSITVVLILIVIFCGIGNIIYQRKKIQKCKLINLKKNALRIGPLIFFMTLFWAQHFIANGISETPVGCLGNNDVFAWAFITDCFLNNANAANVVPSGFGFFERLKMDCYGTYLLLAFFAKANNGFSLEAVPFLVTTLLTLIGALIYEIINFCFRLSKTASLALATLTASNSFLFYIAHNGFLSQLAGTAMYLAVILFIIKYYKKPHKYRKTVLFSILLSGLIVFYPAGSIVFLLSIVCIFLLTKCFKTTNTGKLFQVIEVKYLILSAVLAFFLIPQICLSSVKIICTAADIAAGWPLPFINITYLLSLPIRTVFPGHASFQGLPWVVAIMSIALAVYTFHVILFRKNNLVRNKFLLVYFLFLAAYAFYFKLKPNSYQAWKLASYLILPLGFIPSSAFLSSLSNCKKVKLENGLLKTILQRCFLAFASIYFFYVPTRYQNQSILNYKTIQNIKNLKSKLYNDEVRNLVLTTPAHGSTMILFSLLSKEFVLYPLANSYLAPADNGDLSKLDQQNARMISLEEGKESNSNVKRWTYKELAFNSLDDKFSTYLFRQNSFNSIPVNVLSGLYNAEDWGAWSSGNKTEFEIDISTKTEKSIHSIVFEVNPFGNPEFDILINDVFYKHYKINQKESLNIELKPQVNINDKLKVSFLIKNPISPSELNPDNRDQRLLALGFVSFKIICK